MQLLNAGILLAFKVFRNGCCVLKQFVNMATALQDASFMRLLIPFSLMLMLTSANSTDSGTVIPSMSNTYPTTFNGMEEQLPSTMQPDYGIRQQLTSSPYTNEMQLPLTTQNPDDGIRQRLTSSSHPDIVTEQLSTSRPYPEERIQLTPSLPRNGSERTSPFNNAVMLHTTCTNYSMNVYLNFSRPFQGFAYSKKNFYNESCSTLALPSSTATQVVLELPLVSCGNRMRQIDSGVMISNTIIIQQHQMIPTRFDMILNVSCVLENELIDEVSPSDDDEIVHERKRTRKAVAWLDVCTGSDLYPDEEFRPHNFDESALYMVVKVADMRKHRDMIVRNCIAHDRRFITNDTNLYQLYDFYGCPNNSSVLEEFVITNQTGRFSDMMGYSRVKNFTLFAQGQLFITCGVNLCFDTCNPNCNEPESERYDEFSRVVLKKIVKRGADATTPSTLQLHTEDTEERVRRSVGDVFSDAFHASRLFLSDLLKGYEGPLNSSELSTDKTAFQMNHEQTENISESEETTTNVETTAGTEALNMSSNSEDLDISVEMQMQEMTNSTSTSMHVHKSREISSYASVDSVPSEVFVVAVFMLLVGSYVCIVQSRTNKMNLVAGFK